MVEPTCRAIIVAELLTTYMVILATPVAVAEPAVALLLILIGPPLLDLERGLNLAYPFLLLYFLRILNKVKSNDLDMDVLSLFLQNVKDFIQYADDSLLSKPEISFPRLAYRSKQCSATTLILFRGCSCA